MSRQIPLAALICMLAIVCIATPLHAQGTGQMEGIVRDEQGGVLPGATVSLRNQDSGVTRSFISRGCCRSASV